MRFGIEKYYYKADSDERGNGERDRGWGGRGGAAGRTEDAVSVLRFTSSLT